MLCQHIRIQGATLPILASGWAGTEELVQFGGSAVEGLSFVVTENTWHELFLSFQQRFHKRFGHDPNFAAAYGYEAAQILLDALSMNADPATLKDTILQHKTFPGVQGEFSFDRYGDPSRQHWMVTIQNGDVNILE
jgi:branched-chain amino acid transport system substrate-binding protein